MPHNSELYRHHSPEKLEELGRKLYREKKYAEALEAFNASAKSAGATSLNLLDNRAATHEKLGSLDAALKDGRAMIEMSKGEVQGYLRTGKVLQQKDMAVLALKIYQRGLRLVSVKSTNYELLHKLHDKLTRKLAKPEAKDMLEILPIELFQMIFAYLPFEQICKCVRVSKHWKTLLTAWPCFWTKIDVSGSKRPIREKTIKPWIAYAKSGITEVTLNCSDLQESRVLDILLQKCKLLTKVSLAGGGLLGASLVRASAYATNLRSLQTGSVALSQDTVMQVMAKCPNLEDVSFRNIMQDPYPTKWPPCPKLRSFHMKLRHPAGRTRPTNVTMKEICPQSPLLETLTLESDHSVDVLLGDYDLANLKQLHVDGIVIEALPHGLIFHLPPSLQKLSMKNTKCFKVDALLPLALEFPHLDTLIVTELHGTHLEVLHNIIKQDGPSITKFTASSLWESPEELTKVLLLTRMKHVEILDISESYKVTDKEVAIIADTMQTMWSINLSGTAITGVSVKKLVQTLPKLRRLLVRDCAQISHDAVQWARRQNSELTIA